MIKIYNTLSRQLEEFKTIDPGKVRWYNCGPTVNGLMHLGHARSALAFDTIRRYLEYREYEVNYVMNFTDIEDRMIEVSKREKRAVLEVAEEYLRGFRRDMKSLNLKDATINPRAMLHINQVVDFIRKLEEKGFAYESKGDVYFDIKKFKDYGKLSNQKLENILENTEDAENPNKRYPADFALWKNKKPGEPYWPSPWGEGRPGWHSECVLMSSLYLGEFIDIHSGGQDLIFPHHENEIAQAESLTGKPFVNYWLHNGYVNIDQEKMSKSLGNYVNIVELLKYYSPDAVRLFVLQTHYRSPISFNEDAINQAQITSDRLFDVILLVKSYVMETEESDNIEISDIDKELMEKIKKAREDFIESMNEDFNTSNGFAVVFTFARDVNDYIRKIDEINAIVMKEIDELFDEFRSVFGLYENMDSYHSIETVEKLIKLLIEIRSEFRKEKNWKMSDKIRDDLKKTGITLEDTPKRILWKLTESKE
ncbi:MAG: cysteine--tRNA ligase [Candidatus Heimdallarchaeota archaeon]|nr:cysteine--tRNA ligase [Candidatus Heimdallarchaeota archaeon]MCK4954026.1 cysteine--tRNA ligase [Candidatus Heimdallarchaeota archaeon]